MRVLSREADRSMLGLDGDRRQHHIQYIPSSPRRVLCRLLICLFCISRGGLRLRRWYDRVTTYFSMEVAKLVTQPFYNQNHVSLSHIHDRASSGKHPRISKNGLRGGREGSRTWPSRVPLRINCSAMATVVSRRRQSGIGGRRGIGRTEMFFVAVCLQPKGTVGKGRNGKSGRRMSATRGSAKGPAGTAIGPTGVGLGPFWWRPGRCVQRLLLRFWCLWLLQVVLARVEFFCVWARN